MTNYIIPHTLKARLHNMLADVYNHETQRRKFPTPPDMHEVYGLLAELNRIEELQEEQVA